MKKNIFLFLILLFCQPVFSADVGLEYMIKANKEIYTAGQPVILEFVLKNVSDKPLILFIGDIDYNIYMGLKIINITERDKQPVIKLLFWEKRGCVAKGEFITLKPNETYKTSEDISKYYYKIRHPGKYKIMLSYSNGYGYYDCEGNAFGKNKQLPRTNIDAWKGKVQSNSVTIEIKEGEASFMTSIGRISLGMDIKEVKNILGEKNGIRKDKAGDMEVIADTHTVGGNKFDTLAYRFYGEWGDLEKSFVIFFYNGKVIDWETLG